MKINLFLFSSRFCRALAGTLLVALCSTADEGIWLPNHFPREKIRAKYGVQVTDSFLERLQRASVRVGASGSFVSPRGLIFTNHHVASECIQQLSTKEHDYMANGFYAQSEAEERRCPDLEAQVLERIEDVTAQVNESVSPETPAAEANRRRKANMARIEKECTERTGLRCEVVTLYSGGWYHLYQYKKYDDIRLVFAPETDIAFFGGDPDNFTYPRYCLDVAFLRAYTKGRPAETPNYLLWSRHGVKEGELVFVSGHPASTGRLATYAQLEFFRDVSYPLLHRRLESLIRALEAYSAQSSENKRVARDNLFSQQNSYKAYTGFLKGLRDPRLMELKRRQEEELRAAVDKDPELRREFGKVWEEVAAAHRAFQADFKAYWLLEAGATRGSDLFRIARHVVRLAEERGKPDAERLREYRDAALPSLEASLYAAIPITPSMEVAVLADYFEFLRRELGDEDPTVRAVLGGKSPAEAASQYVYSSRLADVEERKRLASNVEAVRQSEDGMVRLALLLEPRARELRRRYEDQVEAVLTTSAAKIAQLRFRLYGASDYPDATFSLRISYGPVMGYRNDAGERLPYATTFAGLYRKATGKEPYRLPERWLAAKSRLDLQTPLNFVTTADTHGGNSGSPTVNIHGEIVGILFDGNLESLPDRFVYTDAQARSIHVASQAVIEALRKVYRAEALLKELGF
ncbi:MAG TPA: S46 family peptidase [Bryobacteraceae bacterium]|nr:S46 family peptidase [Bryobacteraceae bacterium]